MQFTMCALTGCFVSDQHKVASEIVNLRPLSLHVIYLHTPPVGIYKEYEVPVDLSEWGDDLTLADRLKQLPDLLTSLQGQLNRLHNELVKAPMIAAYDNIMRQLVKPVRLDDWASEDIAAYIYHINGDRIEREARNYILGAAYRVEHPESIEEVLLWIGPPGTHKATRLHELVRYLFGREIMIDNINQVKRLAKI